MLVDPKAEDRLALIVCDAVFASDEMLKGYRSNQRKIQEASQERAGNWANGLTR